MKQILSFGLCLLLAFSAAVGARAQVAAGADRLEFRRGKLYSGEVELSKENAAQYLSNVQADQYTKALTTEKVGSVLAWTGGGIALASGVLWAASEARFRHQESDILPVGIPYGIIGTALGAAVGAGGLVTYLIGRNQVRLVEKRFDGVSQAALDFGVMQSGVGLALRF